MATIEFDDQGVAYGKLVISTEYSTTQERYCKVTISVYGKRGDYGGASDGDYSVTASGFSPSSGSGKLYLANYEWADCGTYTKWVTTDGNGRASASFSARIGVRSPSAGWKYSSYDLTTIDCGTPPSLAGPSRVSVGTGSVQMGRKLLISIDRDDVYCKHRVEYSFGAGSGTIASDVGSSCEWTVPDLASYCNNAVSGRCTITCYTYRNGNYLGSNSTTVELTVPDATKAITDKEKLTLGSSAEVICKRNSANFTIFLNLVFQGKSSKIWEGNKDSYSWTPSYDIAKEMPYLIEGTATIECKTYNGTALVGTQKTTIRLVVPDNDVTRPKVTDFTMEPVSDLPSQFSGLYMRGKTGIKSSITAEAIYSVITEYSLSVGNDRAVGNPATIDIISHDGEVTVTATVKDGRGFKGSKSKTISVIPYSSPKVVPYHQNDNVICERATVHGALDPKGTYLAIRAGKRYTSVMLNGVEQNGCLLRYRWKKYSAPEYGPWITLLAEDSTQTEISTLISGVVDSLSTSYLVELSVLDKLSGEHKIRYSIMTEAVSFVLYDGIDGAAFGKYPEEPHVVEIAKHMTLLVHGPMVVAGEPWQDLGLWESKVMTSVFPHGRHDDTGCYCLKENGNHVRVAFNCAFEYIGNSIEINQKAIPVGYRPPRRVSSICPVDGGFACVSVTPQGNVEVDWVQKGSQVRADVNWIDGYLDYFTE